MVNIKRRQSRKTQRSKRVYGPPKNKTYTPYPGIRGTNPSNLVRVKGIGLPDRLNTNLVYSDSLSLDPSAGTPTPFAAFRLSSVFDPDNALGGGQPTYHDQLAAMYKFYIVKGAKITCQFGYANQTTAGVGPAIVGVQCSDVATLPTTDSGALMSAPNTSYAMLTPGGDAQKVVGTYSAKNTFPYDMADLTALTSANPAINWFAKVFASPIGTDVEQPISVTLIIEYNVEYHNLLQLVDS